MQPRLDAVSLAQSLRDALGDNSAVAVKTDSDGSVVIQLANGSLFRSGSARLSREGRDIMQQVGDVLAAGDNLISVEGHTDNVPINAALQDFYPTNWELSLARANAATRSLQQRNGIDPTRLRATGFGEHRPLVPNSSRENRARNRRVDIRVLP
ncbi:MAG: flagellar motor protein MotB [Pseudomonadota bacterium]